MKKIVKLGSLGALLIPVSLAAACGVQTGGNKELDRGSKILNIKNNLVFDAFSNAKESSALAYPENPLEAEFAQIMDNLSNIKSSSSSFTIRNEVKVGSDNTIVHGFANALIDKLKLDHPDLEHTSLEIELVDLVFNGVVKKGYVIEGEFEGIFDDQAGSGSSELEVELEVKVITTQFDETTEDPMIFYQTELQYEEEFEGDDAKGQIPEDVLDDFDDVAISESEVQTEESRMSIFAFKDESATNIFDNLDMEDLINGSSKFYDAVVENAEIEISLESVNKEVELTTEVEKIFISDSVLTTRESDYEIEVGNSEVEKYSQEIIIGDPDLVAEGVILPKAKLNIDFSNKVANVVFQKDGQEDIVLAMGFTGLENSSTFEVKDAAGDATTTPIEWIGKTFSDINIDNEKSILITIISQI